MTPSDVFRSAIEAPAVRGTSARFSSGLLLSRQIGDIVESPREYALSLPVYATIAELSMSQVGVT